MPGWLVASSHYNIVNCSVTSLIAQHCYIQLSVNHIFTTQYAQLCHTSLYCMTSTQSRSYTANSHNDSSETRLVGHTAG